MAEYKFVKVEEKKEENYKGKVYDLRLKSLDHTYTVENYIVHNCGGSLVAQTLGITSWAIDPLKLGLLFERFVSEDRLITNIYNYFDED